MSKRKAKAVAPGGDNDWSEKEWSYDVPGVDDPDFADCVPKLFTYINQDWLAETLTAIQYMKSKKVLVMTVENSTEGVCHYMRTVTFSNFHDREECRHIMYTGNATHKVAWLTEVRALLRLCIVFV
jgi:hypothetical protein